MFELVGKAAATGNAKGQTNQQPVEVEGSAKGQWFSLVLASYHVHPHAGS